MSNLFNKILQWFGKGQTILYNNSSGWSSDSLTLDGISKYGVLLVYSYPTLSPILCYRVNDYFAGAGVIQGVSDLKTHSTCQCKFTVDDNTDTITWSLANIVNHPQCSSHTVATNIGIRKIVGLLPKKIVGRGTVKAVFSRLTANSRRRYYVAS